MKRLLLGLVFLVGSSYAADEEAEMSKKAREALREKLETYDVGFVRTEGNGLLLGKIGKFFVLASNNYKKFRMTTGDPKVD